MRPEHAGELGVRRRAVSVAGGGQPGQRVQRGVLVVAAAPSARAPCPAPGTSTPPARRPAARSGRSPRWPAPATPARSGRRPRPASSQNSKPSCMVMSSGPSTRMSCRRGPGPGSGGTLDRPAGLGLAARRAARRPGPGRRRRTGVPLQADEHPPVRLGHRRPGHRQHGRQGDRAVAVLLDQRRGRAAAARRRPAPARAGRSTPARRPAPRTGGRRRRPGPSPGFGGGLAAAGSFDACSRRHSLERPAAGAPGAPDPPAAAGGQPVATRSRPARSRPGRTGPHALAQAVPLHAPAAGERRRRCAGPGRRPRPAPAARIRGPGRRRRRRSPGADSSAPGRRRSRQATRTTSPGSGSACRTALPTSSATTATRSASRVGADQVGQLVGEPVPGHRAPGGVVGHHHAPRPFGRSVDTPRSFSPCDAAGSPARGSRTSATVPPPSRGRRIPIHSVAQRSGGRGTAPARPRGIAGGRRTRPARTARTRAPRAPAGCRPPGRRPGTRRSARPRRRSPRSACPAGEYLPALVASSVSTVARLRRSPSALGRSAGRSQREPAPEVGRAARRPPRAARRPGRTGAAGSPAGGRRWPR